MDTSKIRSSLNQYFCYAWYMPHLIRILDQLFQANGACPQYQDWWLLSNRNNNVLHYVHVQAIPIDFIESVLADSTKKILIFVLMLYVQAVSCLAPSCTNPYTPEGECCPRCPTNSKQ